MAPEDLRSLIREQPFRPFRIVKTDGKGYDVPHPDLLWIGRDAAYVGLVKQLGEEPLWERSVRVDLFHVIRVALAPAPPHGANGAGSSAAP